MRKRRRQLLVGAGSDRDLDHGPDGAYVESFALFARMVDDPRYEHRLFGDLSAVTQINRAGPALVRLVELRVIDPALAPVLAEIHRHNPLLFDFVLKRHLNSAGKRLAPAVFETRGFFAS